MADLIRERKDAKTVEAMAQLHKTRIANPGVETGTV
jgi:hypothetical protein